MEKFSAHDCCIFYGKHIPKPSNYVAPVRSRNSPYPRETSINRFNVPDDKIDWNIDYPIYNPVEYTHPKILAGKYDPQIEKNDPTSHGIKFNTIDNKLDRTSFIAEYPVVRGWPLNPMGRTGIAGRASLGRWGPNHAADPIVTRWKRDANNKIVNHSITNKPILQFVSIMRNDVKEWALPGGMVDPGEAVTETVKREFGEEAMNTNMAQGTDKEAALKQIDDYFKSGVEIYRGYSDDPRNTDNAWMETVAINYHDNAGTGLGRFNLNAGDDACNVRWTDLDSSLHLYASHKLFLQKTAELHHAHW